MLEYLKQESNLTQTENGATTYKTSGNFCVDLFGSIGALREANDDQIISRFVKAYSESPNTAMKILFYARDVRGGLGERRVFRIIINYLAKYYSDSIIKNIKYIPEFGRYDDLLSLFNTKCEASMISFIEKQLKSDIASMQQNKKDVSLLAKWLPSINASSKTTTKQAKKLACLLNMTYEQYRKTLSALRKYIDIIENYLREKNYIFDYTKQTSKSLFKYRQAFIRNDNERYLNFINLVKQKKVVLKTGTLYPYDIIRSCKSFKNEEDKEILNTTWNSLPDYCKSNQNSIAVLDGSGSMYAVGNPLPIDIGLSLAIYFAERCNGEFKNHFITFSTNPKLVEIKGETIVDRSLYCQSFNEVSNTDIQKVFELILNTAIKNKLPQQELPDCIYIISDMEFDDCAVNSNKTNFEYAKEMYEKNGYKLPTLVFWNVQSRQQQVPVKVNESGVILVSGASPRIFEMVMTNELNPYDYMIKVLSNKRYSVIEA